VGVAPGDLPRTGLCGLAPRSASVASIGGLLVENRWRRGPKLNDGLMAFRPGDVVGVLAFQDDASCALRFDVNGDARTRFVSINTTAAPSGTFFLSSSSSPSYGKKHSKHTFFHRPASVRLFPTVSFRTPGVAVEGRFSADDIDIGNPNALGVPPGAKVYAVDGTRLV